MAAEIDCVAVTDHNSGEWIDRLKKAYSEMKAKAEAGQPRDGFRELTIFPGVEISVNGGFHLLALFDPSMTTSSIDTLLGKVDYQGTKGDSDGVTRKGAAEVIQAVLDMEGIPVPAHADRPGASGKGLLALRDEQSKASRLDASTLRQVFEIDKLLAVEWEDPSRLFPECVAKSCQKLSRVLGSDCHTFQGAHVPGSRYIWIKMAKPTLEGLRLALLDGNEVSIRRSDEATFDPFKLPRHIITAIEIESARYMGNGQMERLKFSPYYNGLIGGRGTGKSTVIHALRLAMRRDDELRLLDEPRKHFESFRSVSKNRDDKGALRPETEIRVEWQREGLMYRLCWSVGRQAVAVEEQMEDGQWRASNSQATNADRFPMRVFSQGQIAALAGEGRQALLGIIDEAANVESLRQDLDDARLAYFAKRARLRELEGKLATRPEVERKLGDVKKNLDALTKAHHTEVLNAYQRAARQDSATKQTLAQLGTIPERLDALAGEVILDNWSDGTFDSGSDADALTWRTEAERIVTDTRTTLQKLAEEMRQHITNLKSDPNLDAWRKRAQVIRQAYEQMRQSLAQQGISEPKEFSSFVEEQESLEAHILELDRLTKERDAVRAEIETQWQIIFDSRKAITEARARFVRDTLAHNDFVRMEIAPFGFDSRAIERSLRELLEVADDRFESDILLLENGQPTHGLAYDIAIVEDSRRAAALSTVKERLLNIDGGFGGHFQNYIRRKLERSEFADQVHCWFPEDDLRIEYSRGGDGRNWNSIVQGSQGQRSAALLAFLLAFGEEPLILDQPEDDLDNHLIYDLIVKHIRASKLQRQLIIVTHNPNVVVNGDAEIVYVLGFRGGQCHVIERGALQEKAVRDEVCRVMEGGREALARRWARLGREI